MKHVTILALENTMASTVTGPMDIFSQAGVLWNLVSDLAPEPYFQVRLASRDGGNIPCLNNIVLVPHCGIDDIDRTDLIIISSEDLTHLGQTNTRVKKWLLDQHAKGAGIGSVCTGAFLLAETGLLNGKRATTHWGFVDLFRKKYPDVLLRPECLITDEGDVFCCGGAHSYFDLCLYLVEKYCDYETAAKCARALLLDMGRRSQIPYAAFEFQKRHQDADIRTAQDEIEKNYRHSINFDQLATKVGMSQRNFKRRFKKATGDTALSYLQRYRIEAAKRMIENSRMNITEISLAVGYEDVSFFRSLFKRHERISPIEYKHRFASPSMIQAGTPTG